MNEYTTLTDGHAEIVVNRSKFLTYVRHIADEEDAFAALKALRKRHYDATHVCYAFVADAAGTIARFSDDGEPSGTAGAPILTAIRAGGYARTLVAVARYFGGVKLGAGGLTRAYAAAAAAGIGAARAETYRLCGVLKVRLDFALYDKIKKNLNETLCKTLGIEYNECVTLTLADLTGGTAEALAGLTLGRAAIETEPERYILV